MLDLVRGPPHLQPPLAQSLLDLNGFQLLVKEVDLGGGGLMPLVQGLIVVDFGHVPPVVLGQGLKPLSQGGKCGGTPGEGSQELPREAPGHVVFSPGVDEGIEIGDNW